MAKNGLIEKVDKERKKASGSHYTPTDLAGFVARKILDTFHDPAESRTIRVLDPAMGDGELLLAFLRAASPSMQCRFEVVGFDTDREALAIGTSRLRSEYPNTLFVFKQNDFLHYAALEAPGGESPELFPLVEAGFDVVIANPPYVRTQVLGAEMSQALARRWGLKGRVDLYHAFLAGIGRTLNPGGLLGIIVSNRFMTTRSGEAIRTEIESVFDILHIWDLGDTQLFEAAVLPAVLLLKKKNGNPQTETPRFTSIYTAKTSTPGIAADGPLQALDQEGIVSTENGRRVFNVIHGFLAEHKDKRGVWRISTDQLDQMLSQIDRHTYRRFGDLGKIRVGVKSTCDDVYVRGDWMTLPEGQQPELLRPLTTHHIAARYRAMEPVPSLRILYTHEVEDGKRKPADLSKYPRSAAYLESYRQKLCGRKYVLEAGRKWYELWVPQDPSLWKYPKIVFRDISEEPCFWFDFSGSVVNGDCYWVPCADDRTLDLFWLALAVANSSFSAWFYDRKFHNKLYSGRRRFMTQYVEQFPIPTPSNSLAEKIISLSKDAHNSSLESDVARLHQEIDPLIWQSFGLSIEEVLR